MTIAPHTAVAELLPHGARAVLLSEVEACGPSGIVCLARVDEAWLYVRDGRAPALVSLELMAQAAAAWARLAGGEERRIGHLVSARDVRLWTEELASGSIVHVRASPAQRGRAAARFACETRVAGMLVASAELTVHYPAA